MNQKNILIILVIVIVLILLATSMSGKKVAEAPLDENVNEESSQTDNKPASPTGSTAVTKPVPTPVTQPAQAPAVIVTYTDAGFSPSIITIKRGNMVRFINASETGKSMWVASGPHPTHSALPSFDQKTSVGVGGSYTYTFTQTGQWPFHNHLDSRRQGRVIVSYE
jgi:plastocyanin